MQITWNGFGSFTIVGKPLGGEVTVVTDPFESTKSFRFPRSLKAPLVLQSHDGPQANNVTAIETSDGKSPFLVTYAGEYEVQGVMVRAIRAPKKSGDEHVIFRITIEDMTVAFLGALDRELTNAELDALGNIDILILPVGGGDVLSTELSSKVAASVEPRLIVPSHYAPEGSGLELANVDGFCKEVACPRDDQVKLKIKRDKLPVDEMRIAVLTKI